MCVYVHVICMYVYVGMCVYYYYYYYYYIYIYIYIYTHTNITVEADFHHGTEHVDHHQDLRDHDDEHGSGYLRRELLPARLAKLD